ncbi:MAG: calcium/sodium antiporter [bacterium]
MEILFSSLFFVAGLVILYFGANYMVDGSSGLALRMGVKPLVVGLTVVAFGTSAPEMVTSIIAAVTESPQIALGNVIGSNIANVGLIVGVSALILPIVADRSFLRMDVPFLLGSMVLLYLVSIDGLISGLDGLLMLAGLALFIYMTYRGSAKRGEPREEVPQKSLTLRREILYTLGGLAGLTLGAHFMVDSAVKIATVMGVSKLVIGATIVAVGTSLPELATSLAAIAKKQPDIGVGNIIGSNVFNICSVLGVAPLLQVIEVDRHLFFYEYPIMIAFSVVLSLMLAKRSGVITRWEGALLFAGFVAFMTWSFLTGQVPY